MGSGPITRPRGDSTPVGIIRPIPNRDIAGIDDLVDFDGGKRRSARRRWLVTIARLALLLVVGVLVYYAITFLQVRSTGESDQTRAVDAIVVMGAAQYDGRPSPQLAARLDHVVELWNEGVTQHVVVTGGKQPADEHTEAEASADYLTERGVPADAILMESAGHTTYESMRGVADVLGAQGLRSVLVVTDPYHALRARLMAEDVGLTAYVSPTPSSVVRGNYELRRELVEAAGIAVGRIIGMDHI